MKEEQALGQRRHAPEPQVGAFEVRQLVAQGELLLTIGQHAEAIRWHQHDWSNEAGDEWCLDGVRRTDFGYVPQAKA